MRVGRTIWLFLVSWVFALTAHAYEAREVVKDIADLIENNYFDAAKAHEVADELRTSVRAGAFDRFGAPRDLAVELTARLKKVDRHFVVLWLQGAAAADDKDSASVGSTRSAPGERSYGIRTVSMLPGGIGYIDLRSIPYFTASRIDDPARLALDASLQLTSGASAVILDLRNCIGGYALMSSYLVSAFTSADADIFNVIQQRDSVEVEKPSRLHPQPRTSVPLYVLVSGGTASAGESAAYTLQAAKRAVVIGERTSGAANPGGLFPVRDGFNVFISIGTPINPITKTNWEGKGVEPDVQTSSEQALERAQRLALERLREEGGGRSLEVQWALEALDAATKPPQDIAFAEYVGSFNGAEVSLANGVLTIRRDRRMVQSLAPIAVDRFSIVGEPMQRVIFERDGDGRVNGFQLLRSSAYATWYPRSR